MHKWQTQVPTWMLQMQKQRKPTAPVEQKAGEIQGLYRRSRRNALEAIKGEERVMHSFTAQEVAQYFQAPREVHADFHKLLQGLPQGVGGERLTRSTAHHAFGDQGQTSVPKQDLCAGRQRPPIPGLPALQRGGHPGGHLQRGASLVGHPKRVEALEATACMAPPISANWNTRL